jgi:hypothetical protein
MVSNVLQVSEAELIETLERIGREYAEDTEYQSARAELPADWPF